MFRSRTGDPGAYWICYLRPQRYSRKYGIRCLVPAGSIIPVATHMAITPCQWLQQQTIGFKRLRLHLKRPAVRSYYPDRCAMGSRLVLDHLLTQCSRRGPCLPVNGFPHGWRFPYPLSLLAVLPFRRLCEPFGFAALRNSSRQPGCACGTSQTRFGFYPVWY